MNGAYKNAQKTGTLGVGFGGDSLSKPVQKAAKYSSKGVQTKLSKAADKMFSSKYSK